MPVAGRFVDLARKRQILAILTGKRLIISRNQLYYLQLTWTTTARRSWTELPSPSPCQAPPPAGHPVTSSNWTLPPQEAQDEKRVLPLLGGLILLPRCRRLLRSSGVGCNDVNEFNITLGNYQRPNHLRPNQCKSRENASAAPVGVPGMREVLWTRGTKCPVSRGCWTAKM